MFMNNIYQYLFNRIYDDYLFMMKTVPLIFNEGKNGRKTNRHKLKQFLEELIEPVEMAQKGGKSIHTSDYFHFNLSTGS